MTQMKIQFDDSNVLNSVLKFSELSNVFHWKIQLILFMQYYLQNIMILFVIQFINANNTLSLWVVCTKKRHDKKWKIKCFATNLCSLHFLNYYCETVPITWGKYFCQVKLNKMKESDRNSFKIKGFSENVTVSLVVKLWQLCEKM